MVSATPLPSSNDPGVVRVWALAIMRSFGLKDWTFNYNRRVRSLGVCRYRHKAIELSVHLLARNGPEEVRETLLHEIAHALVGPGFGHGPVWKAKATEVGASPVRCGMADMPEGKWRAGCGGCGTTFHRHRRPRRLTGWYCRGCGRDRGQLTWRQHAG